MPASTISFKTHIYHLDSLNMNYLEVPAAIVKKCGGVHKERWQCTVNEAVTWQCGMVALGAGKAYISLNKKLMTQLKVKLGDAVAVSLKKDESKYGMTMPPELKELLAQDKEGSKRFHGLPPGKQRYIIYYVQQVKSSQLRIDRAVMLIENLKKLPKGNESFRGMLGMPPR